MFPILHDRWDQHAGNLSGGEQQQLSLAMAFVTKPKLLCIDELSLGLAPTVVGQLVDKVKEMHAQGTTIVVVEQSINVALLLCERALFLEKGQVRFRGPTAGLLDRPEILRAVFIGAGEGTVTAPTALVPPEQRNNRGLRLECRQLTKRFGGIRAVDAVDLVVEPGHIVGLIGHNGAGKTTLFDLLTGFLPADGGQVLLDGVDITTKPPYKRARLELGRSFQEARLFPSLSVVDALRVSLERHLDNRDPVAAGLRLPASTDSERAATERADELVELLGLGRLPRPPDRRAVDRHPAHRRAGLPAGAEPGDHPARRAVRGRGPEGDGGPRADAPAGPGGHRLLDGGDRARHQPAQLPVRRVRGARAGRGHRPGHAAAGARRPAGHRVVPRHQRGRRPPVGHPHAGHCGWRRAAGVRRRPVVTNS